MVWRARDFINEWVNPDRRIDRTQWSAVDFRLNVSLQVSIVDGSIYRSMQFLHICIDVGPSSVHVAEES